ncbi:hypothetical protein RSAG8_08045, partial [Rhizoctonia solani AG-8 WAC10335]
MLRRGAFAFISARAPEALLLIGLPRPPLSPPPYVSTGFPLMPAYAGFYVSPDDWADWLRLHCPLPPPHGPADAESTIYEALCEQNVGKYFAVLMVPTPPSESEKCDEGERLSRLFSEKREYIAPRAKVDMNGPKVLDRLIGLKVSEWRTIWYNENSFDPPYEAEFLKPKPPKDKNYSGETGDGKQKKGTMSKKKADSDQEGQVRVQFADGV